jgi:DNA polymerase-3 subunit epsilon
VYVRCRLDIPFPILEVSAEPASGHAVTIGPLRGRRLAHELVEQLDSLFGLRHCGRRLPRREYPSAYGQMGRCLSPCLGDLDPNLYRRRLDEALRLFVDGDSAGRLLAHVEGQMRAAAQERRYERALWLRRRWRRLATIIGRLEGVLEATHARPRLVLALHPTAASYDGFWIAGGRLVDWGPLPPEIQELEHRNAAVLARGGRAGELGAHVPTNEVDEVRIVATYLASHPDTPQLMLDPPPDSRSLASFLAAQEKGNSMTSAARSEDSGPTETEAPGATSRRTKASAIAPNRGEIATLPS